MNDEEGIIFLITKSSNSSKGEGSRAKSVKRREKNVSNCATSILLVETKF